MCVVTVDCEQAQLTRRGGEGAELVHFYDKAVKAGHTVDVVSPAGGEVPLDPVASVACSLTGRFAVISTTKSSWTP
ncbi:hypothetical protein ABZZ80_02820 [Streptomyces sp. NPDC006356]